MSSKRIAEPAIEPVTLTEAKAQLVVETSAYDTIIASKIKSARELVESHIGRALVYQTWRTRLDRFPCGPTREDRTIYLTRPPVASVSSITYLDSNGDTQTLSSSLYVVDTDSAPARITEANGESWPSTYDQINAVTITSVHGYADGEASPEDLSAIPQKIKDAILIIMADLYQNREMTVIGVSRQTLDTVESLLWEYRVHPMNV